MIRFTINYALKNVDIDGLVYVMKGGQFECPMKSQCGEILGTIFFNPKPVELVEIVALA